MSTDSGRRACPSACGPLVSRSGRRTPYSHGPRVRAWKEVSGCPRSAFLTGPTSLPWDSSLTGCANSQRARRPAPKGSLNKMAQEAVTALLSITATLLGRGGKGVSRAPGPLSRQQLSLSSQLTPRGSCCPPMPTTSKLPALGRSPPSGLRLDWVLTLLLSVPEHRTCREPTNRMQS